ncbi:MAG: flagellar biosynthesis protein FlhF [Usitatibacteraceae bacterium]
MSMKRFFCATSREAIKQVRAELGDDAVILSNREVDGGVEVIASAPDDIAALIDLTPHAQPAAKPAANAKEAALPTIARVAQAARATFAKATGTGAAFYAKAELRNDAIPAVPTEEPLSESFAQYVQRAEETRAARDSRPSPVVAAPARATARAPTVITKEVVVAPKSAPVTVAAAAATPDPRIMAEILQMKSILREQVDALSWRDTLARRPLQAKQISQMLSAGFSPALARAIAEKLPADFNEVQAGEWLLDRITRNLPVSTFDGSLVDRGGVYALVGPTGVGKTTTAAKLAAHCAMKFGAKSLGLITVDSYRIGAEDQLRAYGKILGVSVHTARDGQSLADLIALMRDKHLVLIDTVGMGQRDTRLVEQMEMLSSPSIERILFLNASAQGETLDDVVRLYGGQGARRTTKVIVSKLDEAVKYGFVLDCMIRHKLEMQYVTNGQRVPEDLHPANPKYLVHRALKHRAAPVFALDADEVPMLLSTPAGQSAGSVNHV